MLKDQLKQWPTNIVLGDFVGKGALGKTYKIVWNKQVLAVKKISKNLLSQAYDPDDIWREIYINQIMSIDSDCRTFIPCYVQILEDSRYYYILLDLLNGQELAAIWKHLYVHIHNDKNTTRVLEILVRIMIQILEAFQWIHQKNVIHNDIHRGNVFIEMPESYKITDKIVHVPNLSQLNVKIIDFGLSCSDDTDHKCVKKDFTEWDMYKFYRYPYPIIEDNHIAQWKAYDLYHVGLMMYEMLTGMPFENILYVYMRPDILRAFVEESSKKDKKLVNTLNFQFQLDSRTKSSAIAQCLKKINWVYPFNMANAENIIKNPNYWKKWNQVSKKHVAKLIETYFLDYTTAQQNLIYKLIYSTMMLMHPNWEKRSISKVLSYLSTNK